MSKVLLCSVLLLACVSVASADNILNVNLFEDCPGEVNCYVNPGFQGGAGNISADFSPIGEPWTFTATATNVLSWVANGDSYNVTFGYGGPFDMTGPQGLTFTGVVTSGTGYFSMNETGMQVNYFGRWSNGLYASGNANVFYDDDAENGSVTLTSQIAPEPSTFALLGTGIAGLWGWRRKMRR